MAGKPGSPRPGFGGKVEGSGRKPGSITKRTEASLALAAAMGESPLEFMLRVMHQPDLPEPNTNDKMILTMHRANVLAHDARRFEAAKAAAPYVHPKLANVELKGPGKNGAIVVTLAARDEDI